MSTSDESERRIAEALRAHAAGARSPAVARPVARAAPRPGMSTRTALLIALAGGAVLGTALALLSLFVPGLLPPLG